MEDPKNKLRRRVFVLSLSLILALILVTILGPIFGFYDNWFLLVLAVIGFYLLMSRISTFIVDRLYPKSYWLKYELDDTFDILYKTKDELKRLSLPLKKILIGVKATEDNRDRSLYVYYQDQHNVTLYLLPVLFVPQGQRDDNIYTHISTLEKRSKFNRKLKDWISGDEPLEKYSITKYYIFGGGKVMYYDEKSLPQASTQDEDGQKSVDKDDIKEIETIPGSTRVSSIF